MTRYNKGATGDAVPISTLKGSDTHLVYPVGAALTPAGNLYVGNGARGAVAEYAKGATGNTAPVAEFTEGISNPEGIALTPEGDVLVANRGGAGGPDAVTTLSPDNPTPIATITGRDTGLNAPIGVALVPPPTAPSFPVIGQATAGDTSARVAFTAPAFDGFSPITSYTATATDLTNPARGGQTATDRSSPITVKGLTNGDSYRFSVTATNAVGTGPASSPSNVVIPGAYFYVTYGGNDSVTEYASRGAAAIATIKGPHTQLHNPYGVAQDPAGNLFVANIALSEVTEYAKGATGDAAPIATIRGPHTQLLLPGALALDRAGNLFVSNYYGNSVTEYAKGATGNAAPIATIAGAQRGSIIQTAWLWTRPGTCSSLTTTATR